MPIFSASKWYYSPFILIHSLNMYAQLASGARDLVFGPSLHLLLHCVSASSEGSDKTANMRSLVLAFTVTEYNKYQNLMSLLIFIYSLCI